MKVIDFIAFEICRLFLNDLLAIVNEIQKLAEMENKISEQVSEKIEEMEEKITEQVTEQVSDKFEEMEEQITEQVYSVAAAISNNCKFRFFLNGINI